MHLQVITPERVVMNDEIQEITLPTTEGEITVLPHHVPLMTILQAGAARVLKEGKEYFIAVSGGFVQVQPGNKIIVLTDTAERAEELDLQKIEAAHKAAQKVLSEARSANNVEYAALAANLERELARLKVVRKTRHTGLPTSAPENE